MQTWGPLEQQAYDQYLAFMREHHTAVGSLGDWKAGETEIVSDRDQVEACIRAMRDRLAAHGNITRDQLLSRTHIGVVYEDQYGFIVRYPVFFPPTGIRGKPGPIPACTSPSTGVRSLVRLQPPARFR
jgi:hypothetical protein